MEQQSQKVRDLIYFFTHNKNLTRQQQARRDKLLARDCVALKDKEKNTNSSNSSLSPHEGEKIQETPKRVYYIPPYHLHFFLYKLNQDHILKYICHEIDTVETIDEINELCGTKTYSFKKHSQLISKALDSLLNDFKRQNIYLDYKFICMLKAYILGNDNKGWSSLNIKTSWNSNDILKWSTENEGKIPSPGKNIAIKQKNNGFRLKTPFFSNINGIRIGCFKELVIYFKSLFHIKNDNSLRKIIEFTNRKIEGVNVIFAENKFNDRIDLLTDVDKLIQAYKSILNICKDVNKDELLNIEVSFYEIGESVFFTIWDTDHCYKKTVKSASERIGESHQRLIKNQINGLCNLYIEADFGCQEYAKIGLWHKESAPLGDTPNITIETLQEAKGVKYILEFCKK